MAESIYRVVQRDGTPVDGRAYRVRGHASQSLRFSYRGVEIQEGTVTWPTLPAESKESTRELVQLALPLEHEDLGLDAAP